MKALKLSLLVFTLIACGISSFSPALAYAKDAQASVPVAGPAVAKVNLNDADLEKLDTIRGVGPALAERIIAYRKENGKFNTIEDIKKVKGIGEAKFNRIKDQLAV